jgi:hypothetical protein
MSVKKKLIALIPEWLKIKVVVPEIHVIELGSHSHMSDQQIWEQVESLIYRDEWDAFCEMLKRIRLRHMSELGICKKEGEFDRLQGRIKTLDYILTLKQNAL